MNLAYDSNSTTQLKFKCIFQSPWNASIQLKIFKYDTANLSHLITENFNLLQNNGLSASLFNILHYIIVLVSLF